MNHGRIEQVGTPRELYEQPANEFVMSFVGPVNRLGDALRAPARRRAPARAGRRRAAEAMVERVVHLGFEVRVELVLEDGQHLWAQLTRDEAEQLELERGADRLRPPEPRDAFSAAARPPGRQRSGDLVGQLAGGEVGEGDGLEHRAQVRAQGDPDLLQRRGGAGVLDLLRPFAADVRERALDRADDVGEGDLGRVRASQ